MATSTTDERLKTGLHRVLALMNESRAPHVAAALYEQLIASDPTDAQALDGLVRSAPLASASARLPGAIMARARVSTDPAHKALLALGAGALEEAAGYTVEAEAAFAFALACEPDFLPALHAAGRLRAQAGDYSAAASLEERAARVFRDPRTQRRHGSMRRRSTTSSRATTRGPWPACALFLRPNRQIPRPSRWRCGCSRRAPSGPPPRACSSRTATPPPIQRTAPAAYARRGAILASRLADTPGAIADFRRALALRPDEEDVTTMEVLAALEERTKNWPEALELHARVARGTSLEAVRQRARLAEARIVADELEDHARAREILEDLARDCPDDRTILHRLAEVARRVGDDERALELYTQLSGSGLPLERARGLIALADVKRASPNPSLSVDADATLSRAFDLAIVDASVLGMLEDHASKDGDLRPFVAHAEAAIGRVPPITPGILAMRMSPRTDQPRKARQPDRGRSPPRRRDQRVSRLDADASRAGGGPPRAQRRGRDHRAPARAVEANPIGARALRGARHARDGDGPSRGRRDARLGSLAPRRHGG